MAKNANRLSKPTVEAIPQMVLFLWATIVSLVYPVAEVRGENYKSDLLVICERKTRDRIFSRIYDKKDIWAFRIDLLRSKYLSRQIKIWRTYAYI